MNLEIPIGRLGKHPECRVADLPRIALRDGHNDGHAETVIRFAAVPAYGDTVVRRIR